MSHGLQRFRARQNSRYDRPLPAWCVLLPLVGSLVNIVVLVQIPRGPHHGHAVTNAALAVYVTLMLLYAIFVWFWMRRHRLPGSPTVGSRTQQVLQLRLPSTITRWAPIGVALFGFLTVITAVDWIEGMAQGNVSASVSGVLFLTFYGGSFALFAEASSRPWRTRRR